MNKRIKDALSTYIFTTKFVINMNSPVIYVKHEEDGN